MFDHDTLIITYDDEPRRAARLAQQEGRPRRPPGLGDCVDCGICVQVCPTGIDIRNGLQYECIGCAACIDGCDQVMDKMGYPRGLIRYTTENVVKEQIPGQRHPQAHRCVRAPSSTRVLMTAICRRVRLQSRHPRARCASTWCATGRRCRRKPMRA
ncbi:MAG: 4Fe-4S dicluster domain-containing protein [Comamonadaceae bacterium]|nr:4Fe-4S dicluster domain-containing protein [Comamonadaceae bacterium]